MFRYFVVVMISLLSLGIAMVDDPGTSSKTGGEEIGNAMFITFNGGIPPMERCMPYPECTKDSKKASDD